jgi:uncharacterized protein YukE
MITERKEYIMANDVIKVSTEDMAQCIARYKAEKAKLMSALAICLKASALLARSWAGPSFAICCAKMANTYKNLAQSEQKMDDAINELSATIGIMEQAESNVSSKVSSLDVGDSPFS